jgi:hypothetical protein
MIERIKNVRAPAAAGDIARILRQQHCAQIQSLNGLLDQVRKEPRIGAQL